MNLISNKVFCYLKDREGFDFVYQVYKFLHQEWPGLSLLQEVKTSLAQRCIKCTLSSTCPDVQLDASNLCKFCQEYQDTICVPSEQMNTKDSPMDTLLDSHSNSNQQYDVAVLFSGGKDSTFLLNTLLKKHKNLKILAVTVDNGFMTEIQTKNSIRIAEKFNVDHVIIPSSAEVYKYLFKFCFENSLPGGFNYFEALTGELMQDTARLYAVKHNIPYIATGYTPQQRKHLIYEDIKDFYTDSFLMDAAKLRSLKRERFCNVPLQKILPPHLISYFWDGSKYSDSDQIPTVIYPYLSWGYNKEAITSSIQSMNIMGEFSPVLTNNVIVGVFIDYKKSGYCTVEPEWAEMVRKKITAYADNLMLFQGVEYLINNYSSLFLKGMEPFIKSLGYSINDFVKKIL